MTFDGKTYTLAELERNFEDANILLETLKRMGERIHPSVITEAEANVEKHWFRLEKARDWATD